MAKGLTRSYTRDAWPWNTEQAMPQGQLPTCKVSAAEEAPQRQVSQPETGVHAES